MAIGARGINRYLYIFEVILSGTKAGDPAEHARMGIDEAYPRHFHAARLDCNAANVLEQFRRSAGSCNRRVAIAQGRIKRSQALRARLNLLALRDVLHSGEKQLSATVRLADTTHVDFGEHHSAILADETLLQGIALGLAAHDAVKLDHVFLQVVRVRQRRPGFFC